MIVDLEEKTECGSFELRGGGKVHLRLLAATDIKKMRKACLTPTIEYPLLDGKYQRFEGQNFNGELFESMSWDCGITGWDNVFDRNEKAIPVTPENKVLLMERVPEFRLAVEAGMKALKEAEAKKEKELEKN